MLRNRDDLHLRFQEFHFRVVLQHETDDVIHGLTGMVGAVAHRGDADCGYLPQSLTVHFGSGHPEPVPQPGDGAQGALPQPDAFTDFVGFAEVSLVLVVAHLLGSQPKAAHCSGVIDSQ